MKKYVIVVAGGSGSRMGAEVPKQFLLLHGKPILMHTLEVFHRYDVAMSLILVLPEAQKEYWISLCQEHDFHVPHQIVNGGNTRFHSVKNGLQLVPTNALVAVHDGVRPLIAPEVLDKLFAVAEEKQAAYPVVPVVETLRQLTPDGKSVTVDRSQYFLVQTPQVFLSDRLLQAYQTDYIPAFTDDVSVVEHQKICCPVPVEGNRENIKITTPTDLIIAATIMYSHSRIAI
jgi:2-C-methyl-D-erythritol 4-phosphate cytidylyltransferase